MRINHLLSSIGIVCLSFILFLSSCNKDNDRKELIVTISSVKQLFNGYETSPTYFVKHDVNDNWQNFYNGIEGFEHVEGHEYVLHIWQEQWHNGEIQDAGIYKYGLIEIISDIEKDSENIPDQRILTQINFQKNPANNNYAIRINNKWEEIEPLEGFEYEPWYEYAIIVNARYNGSKATPRYTYSYVETVNKLAVDGNGNE